MNIYRRGILDTEDKPSHENLKKVGEFPLARILLRKNKDSLKGSFKLDFKERQRERRAAEETAGWKKKNIIDEVRTRALREHWIAEGNIDLRNKKRFLDLCGMRGRGSWGVLGRDPIILLGI